MKVYRLAASSRRAKMSVKVAVKNATKTTMHSISHLHQTAGEANANILCFDGGGTGTGSCFGIPGDDEAETIRAVQSSIPEGVGGDAVDAGDVDVE